MSHPDFIQALLDPRAYPHRERPGRIDLNETHNSWLLFTERHVYKIKKPVDFGFLDFSTLEKRRFFCHEELLLNRRLSPDVYLGVVEVRERDGQFTVAAPGVERGKLVDYAVKMRRLPQDCWLSERLAGGADVSVEVIRRIADRIALFHENAETNDQIRAGGALEAVRYNVEENFTQVAPFIGGVLQAETYDSVRAYSRAFMDSREGAFRARESGGKIRDCHGDLHLAQICVENGISFIDCIEFNHRFRYSDVAADIAFPAMDLDHYGRGDLSRILVDEYQRCATDDGLRGVLPFYQCYRAFTRGKVACLRLRQLEEEGGPEEEREEAAAHAQAYFELARRYSSLSGPILILTTGLMASGKSVLTKLLSKRLGAVVLRSDAVRKELAGISGGTRRFERWGEGIYSPEFTQETYDEIHRRVRSLLRDQRIVILDASYPTVELREQARVVALEEGASSLVLEVVCTDAVRWERLQARHRADGESVSDGRVELMDDQRERYEPPDEIPPRERVRVATDRAPEASAYACLESIYVAVLS